MATASRAGQGQRQELHPGLPCWGEGAGELDCLLGTLAGSWLRCRVPGLQYAFQCGISALPAASSLLLLPTPLLDSKVLMLSECFEDSLFVCCLVNIYFLFLSEFGVVCLIFSATLAYFPPRPPLPPSVAAASQRLSYRRSFCRLLRWGYLELSYDMTSTFSVDPQLKKKIWDSNFLGTCRSCK